MKILMSNDDGVNAKGLMTLAASLSSLATVTVVAPDKDRSAASNSLTLDLPLRIRQQENGFYAVDGTPTDCIHLAITGWLDFHPDMVVSGINAGANLGDDVLYSGTVAAAMEGRFMGYPAMAFSLVNHPNHLPAKGLNHYETAGIVAKTILQTLLQSPLHKDTILNVNIPDKPISEIKGIQVTRLGHRHIAEKIIPSMDARGNTIYWIGPAGAEQDAGPGTDFYAINQNFVSITPIKIDLTDYAFLDPLKDWVKKVQLVP
ncbi:MAG: 5'/3'-nucleotidase SurE [Proteobacteria bacterium]|nr:5'/3'-nucleotidase SurE [Pseudomonadota bacterium]